MRSKCGSIEELTNKTTVKSLFGAVISLFSVRAFAEEADPNTDDGGEPTKPSINYEDLIAKARKEEKDKQYKTIEKLKTQNNTLTEQHNNDLLKIADLEEKLKVANEKLSKTGDSDSEAVKTLKSEVSTLTKEKSDLEKKVADLEKNKPVSREEVEAEVRAELEAEYEVKTYKAEKLAEHKDDLYVPELVMGDTKEAIDASLQVALARSKEIAEKLGVSNGTKKRTPKTPNNPDVSHVQDNQYSYEYLASLDPASKEYAEVRQKLGLR